jgi:hypothetical protein
VEIRHAGLWFDLNSPRQVQYLVQYLNDLEQTREWVYMGPYDDSPETTQGLFESEERRVEQFYAS